MASTTLITDMTTVADGTFSDASKAKAIAANGPIQDLSGNATLVLRKLQEANVLLTQMLAAVDAADPLKTTMQSVLDSLA